MEVVTHMRWRIVLLLSFLWVGSPASAADAPPRTKIRIATASASLSYLPVYIAYKKGFFAKRGFDVEMIQMSASLTAPALLSRAVDYTIIPSTIATAAARGAPGKVIHFSSVKLQHTLMARPEFATIPELAGKRFGSGGLGNLTAYEINFLIERYNLGSKTTILAIASTTDRLLAMQKGLAEAAIIAAPMDLKGEEMGLRRLLHMGTVMPIPQAGLATIDEKIKTKRSEVIDVLKASIEGLDFVATQREETADIIAKWMALTPAQGLKAYDLTKETFSRDGVPTPEQSKAYIAMLAATANVSADLPAATIFDFSLSSAAAKELAAVRNK